jgi:hypothetical protein
MFGALIGCKVRSMLLNVLSALRLGSALCATALLAMGCTPTVKVEAPRDPITINLNIKLDADVRLRVEEQAKEDVKTKPIF